MITERQLLAAIFIAVADLAKQLTWKKLTKLITLSQLIN
jgi:hypothetical protein